MPRIEKIIMNINSLPDEIIVIIFDYLGKYFNTTARLSKRFNFLTYQFNFTSRLREFMATDHQKYWVTEVLNTSSQLNNLDLKRSSIPLSIRQEYEDMVIDVLDDNSTLLCSPVYHCRGGPTIAERIALRRTEKWPSVISLGHLGISSLLRDPLCVALLLLLMIIGLIHLGSYGYYYHQELEILNTNPLANSRIMSKIESDTTGEVGVYRVLNKEIIVPNLYSLDESLLGIIGSPPFYNWPIDEIRNHYSWISKIIETINDTQSGNFDNLYRVVQVYMLIRITKHDQWHATIMANRYDLHALADQVEEGITSLLLGVIVMWLFVIGCLLIMIVVYFRSWKNR